MSAAELLVAVSQTVLALAGAIIAYSLYGLNCRQREDSWSLTLREFHQFFWMNESCASVRAWLACDDAYSKVQPILEKRMAGEPLTEDEYRSLEMIDKFAALLTAFVNLQPEFSMQRDVSYRLFDDYWLGC